MLAVWIAWEFVDLTWTLADSSILISVILLIQQRPVGSSKMAWHRWAVQSSTFDCRFSCWPGLGFCAGLVLVFLWGLYTLNHFTQIEVNHEDAPHGPCHVRELKMPKTVTCVSKMRYWMNHSVTSLECWQGFGELSPTCLISVTCMLINDNNSAWWLFHLGIRCNGVTHMRTRLQEWVSSPVQMYHPLKYMCIYIYTYIHT